MAILRQTGFASSLANYGKLANSVESVTYRIVILEFLFAKIAANWPILERIRQTENPSAVPMPDPKKCRFLAVLCRGAEG